MDQRALTPLHLSSCLFHSNLTLVSIYSISLLWYWGQVGWSLTATGKGFSGENNFNISNGDEIKGVETNCSNQKPAFPVQSVF